MPLPFDVQQIQYTQPPAIVLTTSQIAHMNRDYRGHSRDAAIQTHTTVDSYNPWSNQSTFEKLLAKAESKLAKQINPYLMPDTISKVEIEPTYVNAAGNRVGVSPQMKQRYQSIQS